MPCQRITKMVALISFKKQLIGVRFYLGIFQQGLHGSWKTWKVPELHCGILKDWKVVGKKPLVLESL